MADADPWTALTNLHTALLKRDEQMVQIDTEIKSLQEYQRSCPNMKSALEAEVQDLIVKVTPLEEKNTALERVRNSSRDARKMYGDSTPGDVTHEQVALDYKSFFKDAFRKLPQNIPSADKYELWEVASGMFTEAYDINKEAIVNCVIREVRNAAKSDDCLGKTDEKTTDICRAYEILTQVMQLKESLTDDEKEELVEEVKKELTQASPACAVNDSQIREAVDIAWSTVSTVAPAGQSKLLTDYSEKLFSTGQRHAVQGTDSIERRERQQKDSRLCNCCENKIEDKHSLEYRGKLFCQNCLCHACGKPTTHKNRATYHGDNLYHVACLSKLTHHS